LIQLTEDLLGHNAQLKKVKETYDYIIKIMKQNDKGRMAMVEEANTSAAREKNKSSNRDKLYSGLVGTGLGATGMYIAKESLNGGGRKKKKYTKKRKLKKKKKTQRKKNK
jgi:hypothetical protein